MLMQVPNACSIEGSYEAAVQPAPRLGACRAVGSHGALIAEPSRQGATPHALTRGPNS
jgi:hypothetical protein